MATYKIVGGHELTGAVAIGGSKNASLPIVCATLLTTEQCVLRNVPEISDIRNLIKILEGLGSKITFENHTLTIDNSGANSFQPDEALVKKLRGSILLMGPLLARFKHVRLPVPGGDKIGARPIDAHLEGLRSLGAKVDESAGNLDVSVEKLVGKRIILTEMSVTATENVIMAAVLSEGKTTIHLAATEPHVQDLCRMLNKMGAKIENIGTHDLVIEGVEQLHGTDHTIIFDNEVAASFVNLAAATKSEMVIDNIQPDYLNGAIIQWQQMGVNLQISKNSIKVSKPVAPYQNTHTIKASIYPGLLTDYIPPFAVLATQAEGKTIIHEWMYEGRLGYIHELSKMGAHARLLDQHRAEVFGPSKLRGTNVSSLDVRSGMVLIIAALTADGTSVLHDIEHIERGYEDIVNKLKSLGANIERQE